MTIERIVALNVNDNIIYQKYRDAMSPILISYGGQFVYDFTIDEVLKSEVKHIINRVFMLRFNTEKDMQDFFSNNDYLAIKKQYFTPSVSNITEIAKYEK